MLQIWIFTALITACSSSTVVLEDVVLKDSYRLKKADKFPLKNAVFTMSNNEVCVMRHDHYEAVVGASFGIKNVKAIREHYIVALEGDVPAYIYCSVPAAAAGTSFRAIVDRLFVRPKSGGDDR